MHVNPEHVTRPAHAHVTWRNGSTISEVLTFHLALVLKYHVHTFTPNQLIFITEAELPVPKPDMMLNPLNQTNMIMSFFVYFNIILQ